MTNINIIIAGYGVFGSKLTNYLTKRHKNIKINCIIEPNRHKRDLIKKLGFNTCEHVLDLSAKAISGAGVLVDCSPRGEGIKNKVLYKELGIKAIFQNGEESKEIGQLYYPKIINVKNTDYLKIPLCSGLAIIKMLDALKTKNIPPPDLVCATHSKVTNTARMLTIDYMDSIEQIQELFNIPAKMDVIYLRGEPYNGKFAYFGKVNLYYKDRAPNIEQVSKAINAYPTLEFISQDLDLLTTKKHECANTLIVKESLQSFNNCVSFVNMSYTPDVNFPIVVKAIEDITSELH